MKKLCSEIKWKKYVQKRSVRELRKLGKENKSNSLAKNKRLQRKLLLFENKKEIASFVLHPAPKRFNFVDNPDEVLDYLKETEKHFRLGRGVNFDKSKVEELTSDAIALFIAFLSGKVNNKFRGNVPEREDLLNLFEESGFYDYVRTLRKRKLRVNSEKNLLHRESNKFVSTAIAADGVARGIKHTGIDPKRTDAVYDILIECMQNTNNHASLHKYGNCNWWLYVHNDPKEKITRYSFVDLGVGIFRSLVANGLVKKFFKTVDLLPNIKLVDDLLNGRIQSRIEEDNEIRGKGIPQIVGYAKTAEFRKFYIIANDVKINVKTGEKEQLKNNLAGTFLYWELQKE